MKVTVTYDSVEDGLSAHEDALNGWKYKTVLQELDRWLRAKDDIVEPITTYDVQEVIRTELDGLSLWD